jgi:hypothetical protein
MGHSPPMAKSWRKIPSGNTKRTGN